MDEHYTGNPHPEDQSSDTGGSEYLDIDATLNSISDALKPGETLLLDVESNDQHQTDAIYDTLIMRGFQVKKSFRNGRHQIIVNRKS